MEVKDILNKAMNTANKIGLFLHDHPRFVALMGFAIAVYGLWKGDMFLVGFGCGEYVTAIFYL